MIVFNTIFPSSGKLLPGVITARRNTFSSEIHHQIGKSYYWDVFVRLHSCQRANELRGKKRKPEQKEDSRQIIFILLRFSTIRFWKRRKSSCSATDGCDDETLWFKSSKAFPSEGRAAFCHHPQSVTGSKAIAGDTAESSSKAVGMFSCNHMVSSFHHIHISSGFQHISVFLWSFQRNFLLNKVSLGKKARKKMNVIYLQLQNCCVFFFPFSCSRVHRRLWVVGSTLGLWDHRSLLRC